MNNYSTEIATAELNENGLSNNAGWIKAFHVDAQSREYLSASMEYLMLGVGLPAHSYSDEPELPPVGQALRRDAAGTAWEHVPDFRGITVYSTETREVSVVTELGAVSDGFTLLEPTTAFDSWDGEKWVMDTVAQLAADAQAAQEAAQQELATRLATANARIQTLSDAVDLEMATDEEKVALAEWKKYRILLSRLVVDTAPDIDWPQAPQQ